MMEAYVPDRLPLQNLDYTKIVHLVGRANDALSRYDGLLEASPNPEIVLNQFIRREATLSSRIEGTQATEYDVLEHEAGVRKSSKDSADIQEIINYQNALKQGSEYLKDRPISLVFVRQLHHILLGTNSSVENVQRQGKSPGEFRQTQNWIARPGRPIEEARFIPPSPMILQEHLNAWQNYLQNNSENEDILVKTAIIHAQFEILHPFIDGNGRIGRILIPLFLYYKKRLAQPKFYLSEYLETNRKEYYDRLRAISEEGDWNGWIAFFLKSIIVQAEQYSKKIKEIMSFYEKTKKRIVEVTHSQYSGALLDAIFARPIFKATDLSKSLIEEYKVNPVTVSNLLKKLKQAGLLSDIVEASGRRSAIILFRELLDIAER